MSWSNWASLGGNLNGFPEVASNRDGRLEVFVRGSDKPFTTYGKLDQIMGGEVTGTHLVEILVFPRHQQ
jgi:hypothetical protein